MFYILLGALGLVLLLGIGAIILGDSMLKKKSAELVELKVSDQVLEQQQTALLQAKKDLEKYKDLESIARSIVPKDKDQAEAVQQISQIAAEANVDLTTISFPSSNLGQKTTTAKPSTEKSETPAPAAPPVSQVVPVSGISGVYQLDVTIVSNPVKPVTYAQLVDFLERLEKNRRTAQVSGIVIDPNDANRSLLTFTLTVGIYLKP
ncbi:MAG: hypothetical protein AAB459_02850 [Patescibacteria group bacterium]